MTLKQKFKNIWNYFTTYEKVWVFSILILSFIITALTLIFPDVLQADIDGLDINPFLIMILYLLDIIFNIICELLISKQSRWNFIVSLLVEITEIATLIVLAERFATMAVTIFFWIPIDIISFINWNKHKDKKDNEVTEVRSLKGWQQLLIILAIIAWTIGIGYLLTVISPDGLLESGSIEDTIVCYLDAFCSAVGICNGLFILFRFKEQWVAWYLVTILETAMNIIMGQWVLLVLKAGYLTNTTYGLVKWSSYIEKNKLNNNHLKLDKNRVSLAETKSSK